MILIKLGGSIISDKEKPFSFNVQIVKNIAREIKKFYPSKEFIIVHGGGSFGHPLAKKYGIRDGINGMDIKKMQGISYTHEAMLDLNKMIINIFLEEELPAFSISPSSIFIINNGNIVYGEIKVLKELLKRKFIPVLFGDVAVSEDKGMDILSGDQIMAYLANEMAVEKAIFLMDVDGIYDGNPREGAKLIEEINEDVKIDAVQGKFDVTGGIKNKLEEALKMDCMVYFINGMKKGNLTKAIEGKKVGSMKKERIFRK